MHCWGMPAGGGAVHASPCVCNRPIPSTGLRHSAAGSPHPRRAGQPTSPGWSVTTIAPWAVHTACCRTAKSVSNLLVMGSGSISVQRSTTSSARCWPAACLPEPSSAMPATMASTCNVARVVRGRAGRSSHAPLTRQTCCVRLTMRLSKSPSVADAMRAVGRAAALQGRGHFKGSRVESSTTRRGYCGTKQHSIHAACA